ncbi:MAG TPA: glycosyltransferase [Thermoanaerobaculia bacterium]|nr:glycosyltransferase [Thermoanaerobaculia bacterium]
MRILYATPGYKPAYRIGGPILSVSAAAERLVRKGHEVTVVTTNANLDQDVDVPLAQPVDVEGVTVWYFRREEPLRKWLPFVPYLSRSMGYMYAPELRAALDRLVPQHDVVDTQMPFVYPTYAASRAALRHHKPLFYHQRGNYLDTHLGRRRLKKDVFIRLFEKPVMRRATALIALTGAERDAFAAVSPGTLCEVVPNGIDIPPIDPSAAARVESRHGIPRDAQLILYLARLHPWKGADELLGAFAILQREFPKLWLVMAGADECDARTRWAGTERVLFPGVIGGEVKADLLQRADVFSLPSQGEGLSMAILEAMANRTALVLSPGCHFPEAEEVGAGVIAAKDASAIAAAMRELLRDPARLAAMGEAGRKHVEQKYSWDVVADRLIDVYSRR